MSARALISYCQTTQVVWMAVVHARAQRRQLKLCQHLLRPAAVAGEAGSLSLEEMLEYPGAVQAPEVTADPARALEALDHDGVVIFTAAPASELRGLDDAAIKALVATVPRRVFGKRLAWAKEPTRVARGAANPLASLPHQDAAGPYGNAMSDYMVLMGDTPAERGGESYVLDAWAILAALEPRLRAALADLPFSQTAAHHTDFGREPLPPGSAAAEQACGAGLWGGPLYCDADEGIGSRPFFRCPTGGGTSLHIHQDEPAAWCSAAEQALGAEAIAAYHHAVLLGMDSKVILAPPCILRIENHEWNIQGSVIVTSPSTARSCTRTTRRRASRWSAARRCSPTTCASCTRGSGFLVGSGSSGESGSGPPRGDTPMPRRRLALRRSRRAGSRGSWGRSPAVCSRKTQPVTARGPGCRTRCKESCPQSGDSTRASSRR
jgi:hypothetical protein